MHPFLGREGGAGLKAVWESARGELWGHEEHCLFVRWDLGLGGGLRVRSLKKQSRTGCGVDQGKDFCLHPESSGKSSVLCVLCVLSHL